MTASDTGTIDERMMRRCFALAAKSAEQGEYPYGAVIVRNGKVVAETVNRVAQDHDVTRHAEVVAICEAQTTIGGTDLSDCTIYTNVEPCAFCSYAIRECRIAKVVYSIRSPVMGGASRWNILGDRKLSDTMPEVFAPPPVVRADFLAGEADATLRKISPLAWAYMHARGLLESRHNASGNPGDHSQSAGGWLMRILRTKFFDRFGRGGNSRPKKLKVGDG